MNKRTKILIGSTLAFALGVTGVAGAVQAERSGDRGERHQIAWKDGGHHGMKGHHRGAAAFMERYDSNGDGRLTQAEIDQARTDRLGSYDQDGSNSLSLAEFEALWLDFHRVRMVDDFQRYDADGDGNLTLEEYREPTSRIVARMDRNGDGALDKEDRPQRGDKRDREERRGDSN